MTLCPNCGSWIAEEELDCGCFTCGFSFADAGIKTADDYEETDEHYKTEVPNAE